MEDEQEIQVQIHCRNLPGIRFRQWTRVGRGIQKGKKVNLSAERVEASVRTGKPIEISVDMTHARGGPTRGSVSL